MIVVSGLGLLHGLLTSDLNAAKRRRGEGKNEGGNDRMARCTESGKSLFQQSVIKSQVLFSKLIAQIYTRI